MGIILDKQYPEDALANLFDHMELFAMGYSWGGYESLLIPTNYKDSVYPMWSITTTHC